MSEDDY